MAKKGQTLKQYEQNFKEKVVKEKLEEGKGYKYLANKYGIPQGTIETWVYQFRRKGSLTSSKKGRPKQDKNIDYKEKYEILKKYMGFLEEVDREKK